MRSKLDRSETSSTMKLRMRYQAPFGYTGSVPFAIYIVNAILPQPPDFHEDALKWGFFDPQSRAVH